MTSLPDLSAYSDVDLEALRSQVLAEIENRYVRENAAAQAEALSARWAVAVGRFDGDEWTQPTGAHDAYREGAIVTYEGRRWESTHGANVHPPGVSGWRELAEPDPETGEPGVAAWTQPAGAHDAYKKGDRVRFEGGIYESTIDGNVWAPNVHGWEKVG